MKPIKVLIIDDSALIRKVLSNLISTDDRFVVCGTAEDPYVARDLIKQLNPDVLTLDIEMPRMNGITFLKNLMRLRPMPVVMISTLTHEGAPETLEALAIGAVDFIGKPKQHSEMSLDEYRTRVLDKLFAAASANLTVINTVSNAKPSVVCNKKPKDNAICVIGSSTGGTEALKVVLSGLPEQCPPIVVAQHIPAIFSASLARRLNDSCELTVLEAEHNQLLQQGHVYIAKGGVHLKVVRRRDKSYCQFDDSELVNRHKPSVEVLFDSVREVYGADAVGVILTGMGSDGAQAMLRMRQAGCYTLAQDEATSVVWGMPGVAVQIGAACAQFPLGEIPERIKKQILV